MSSLKKMASTHALHKLFPVQPVHPGGRIVGRHQKDEESLAAGDGLANGIGDRDVFLPPDGSSTILFIRV